MIECAAESFKRPSPVIRNMFHHRMVLLNLERTEKCNVIDIRNAQR